MKMSNIYELEEFRESRKKDSEECEYWYRREQSNTEDTLKQITKAEWNFGLDDHQINLSSIPFRQITYAFYSTHILC